MFSWNSPSDDKWENVVYFLGMFQSLFSWNSPSDFPNFGCCIRDYMFQSLFSWNSPSDDRGRDFAPRVLHVSILVFVELALGLPAEVCDGDFPMGFNPCFRGTRPRTRVDPCGPQEHNLFQSLFSWNSPSDTRADRRALVILWFQSLFSWNSPSDGDDVIDRHQICTVSILVFVELALGHRANISRIRTNSRFNPCFRGTRPRTLLDCKVGEVGVCFNPCFRGTRPRTNHPQMP